MRRIATRDAELFQLPLNEVLSDAMHGDQTHFGLVGGTGCLDGALGRPPWKAADHSFPIEEHTTGSLVMKDRLAVAPSVPGTSVEFDWKKLGAAHTVAASHRINPEPNQAVKLEEIS